MTDVLLVALGLLPVLVAAGILGLRHPLWVLAAYAAVVPWGSAFSLPLGLPAAFSSISTLAGLAAAVALSTHVAVAHNRAQQLQPAVPLAAMLAGAAALTTAWSVRPSVTISELLVLLSLIALFIAAGLMAPTADDVDLIERALILGGAIVGVYALVLLVTGSLPIGSGIPRFEMPGGGGENGDPNITAASLLLPLFVAMARGLRASGQQRLNTFIATGLIVFAVVLTGSRGGMLAMLLGAAFLGLRGLGAKGIFVLLVPLLIGLAAYSAAPPETQERFERADSTGRTGVWRIGLIACEEHCAIGAGWGTFPDLHEEIMLTRPEVSGNRLRYVAHNVWLQAVVEIGVLGLALLVALLLATAMSLRPIVGTRRAAALAAIVSLAFTNTFLSNLDFKYFWMTLIYATMVSAMDQQQPVTGPTSPSDQPRAVGVAGGRA